ncbi:MAG: hypothetical protein ABH854_01270 [Candidatus Diapherotrites archaeon]|nr:hypothetical protein [Candidatus Micrarchaeota archaeon]MBU1939609.1 hypothetical protein [Candidatus Micrarchaeota archaeon]
MICFIAMFVFAILGIFSATHRAYAFEAFDCVFRRVTLRKCTTAFDKKVKMRVSTGLMKRNEALGGFVFRHFELISWFFTIITIASLIYSAVSIYNIAVYGTCTPEHPEQCALTPQEIDAGAICSCEDGTVGTGTDACTAAGGG